MNGTSILPDAQISKAHPYASFHPPGSWAYPSVRPATWGHVRDTPHAGAAP